MQDNYKGYRSATDEFFWKIPGDVPGHRRRPDPFQGVRAPRNPDYQGAPSSRIAHTANHQSIPGSQGKSFNWLTLLVALLLVSALGVVGYNYYDLDAVANTKQVVAKIDPAKATRVFELTLGKENKTHTSKVRIITHVVVKGDTLWDIAETYVKDPFRYPELAKLSNIRNPDLIYPYGRVRIRIYE